MHLGWQLAVHEQTVQHFLRRVDRCVSTNFLFHELAGGGIGVGIADFIADLGNDFGVKHVVDEGAGGFDVFRVRRNRQHVEPQVAALFRGAVSELHALARFFCTSLGLEHIARETCGNAYIAVGQIGDVFGRVEIGYVRTNRHQLGFGLLVIGFLGTVGVQPQVVEHGWQHFIGGIKKRYSATGQLLDVLRLEQHRPGVDLVDTEHRLDLVDVITDAVGAPQVRDSVLVARIVFLQTLEQRRVEVFVVGQQRLVELLERARLDLLAEEVIGRHHHVVAGAPGQQLGFQGFVGVEHVVHRLDAGSGFEVCQGGLADVIGPVINMHGGFSLGTEGQCQAGSRQQGFGKNRNRQRMSPFSRGA
ncbi:Uncharacterized protein AC502_0218 [Pseudomonas syringae pv. maculicola]|nr:Uncharacterized protein AC502_0218 [Pseudomonas syringae pv. maculicola]